VSLLRDWPIQTVLEWAKSSSSFWISVSVSRSVPASVMISYVSGFRSVLESVMPFCAWAFRSAPAWVKPFCVLRHLLKASDFLSGPCAFAFAASAWAKQRTF
jgi:hypothetical protein